MYVDDEPGMDEFKKSHNLRSYEEHEEVDHKINKQLARLHGYQYRPEYEVVHYSHEMQKYDSCKREDWWDRVASCSLLLQ